MSGIFDDNNLGIWKYNNFGVNSLKMITKSYDKCINKFGHGKH